MTDQETSAAAPETAEAPRLTVALLAAAALAWTAVLLWFARANIMGRDDVAMEVTSTAWALPGAVSAAMVSGAAVALATPALLGRRRPLGASSRFLVATGAGLLVGLLCAAPMVTINTAGSMYAVVGGTVAAAATIGGAIAGFRIPSTLGAAAWATLGVFLIGAALNYKHVQNAGLDLLGGEDAASLASASQWYSYLQGALSGLAAGLIAYAVLRRARRAGDADLRWPFYALAGAGPGLLLILSEILTRTAGARVLELAGKVSELETTVQQMLSTSRLNSALIVLFVGAFTAIVAVGRTLGPAVDEVEESEPVQGQSKSSSSDTAYHSNS